MSALRPTYRSNISRILLRRSHPSYFSSLCLARRFPRRPVTVAVATVVDKPTWSFRYAPKRSLATQAAAEEGSTIGGVDDLKIKISERAAKRLGEIRTKDKKPDLALRVLVESGGCHGFQYSMSLTEEFDDEEDIIFERDGSRVVLDKPSLKLLKGSTIDYTMELIGSQFKVVDNPYATSSCGCGSSFDLKM